MAVTGGIGRGPVLGIETSCDETAVAILAQDGTVLAANLLSQTEHAAFGGVVPEVAARAHLAHLPAMISATLDAAGLRVRDLGGIVASTGPGLIGGLIVGSGVAKGMAMAAGLPFVAVNHLEAHALTARLPWLEWPATFPYLLILLSGGHCQCVAVDGVGRYRRLGGTIDDAVGEAFDKVAKLLGLPWPGGPALERLADKGDASSVELPRPLIGRPGCDFSFSGLKTAVARKLDQLPPGALTMDEAANLAASFQRAVADVLADRARHAAETMPDATCAVVAGGVAANRTIRAALTEALAPLPLVAPPVALCTDNAVMVAWCGIERLRLGLADGFETPPRPRWPLDEMRAA